MPSPAFLPSLLLLLLSLLFFAVPSLARPPSLTPVFALNNPHRTLRLTTCLPPAENRLLALSPPVRCPCIARFTYTRPLNRTSRAAPPALDFLLIAGDRNIRAAAAGLPFPVHLAHRARAPAFDSLPFHLDLPFRFAVALRTTHPLPDCAATVHLTLHPRAPTCPIVLPAAAGRLSSAPAPAPAPAPRIVGGNVPHPSLRSHMVAFVAGSSFTCSGSLISPRWAITAAHCRISTAYSAYVGAARVSDGSRLRTARVYTHPSYDPRRDDSPFDIALVQFADKAPDGTRFIRCNNNKTVPEPGVFSRAFGYGQTQEKPNGSGPLLRQVDVPVVPMEECKRKYAGGNSLLASKLRDDVQLCAGRVEGGCDACQGDSGGPLAVFDSEGNVVQIGVVSFGIGCAREDFPGVYTRLSSFEDWLISVGAEYTRSTDGRTVFAKGSDAVLASEFSILGLNLWQSIAVLVAAGIGLCAFVLMFAYPMIASRVRGRGRRQYDEQTESSEAPPPTYGGESFAHAGLGPNQSAQQYAPVYRVPPSAGDYGGVAPPRAGDYYTYYEGQPLPPYTEPQPLPPYTELQAPPAVYGATSFEDSNQTSRPARNMESTRDSGTEEGQNAAQEQRQGTGLSSPDWTTAMPSSLYPPNSDADTRL